MKNSLTKYRTIVDKQENLQQNLLGRIEEKNTKIKETERSIRHAQQALFVIQKVAKETQQQLEYQISELATLALNSVFDEPYKVRLIYETRNNRTEAKIILENNKGIMDPVEDDGGGIVDILAFSLRVSLWAISMDKTENVIIVDEPFKMLSQDLREKAAEMLKEISNKLKMQIIMVTHEDTLTKHADKVFKVVKKRGVSTVEEI